MRFPMAPYREPDPPPSEPPEPRVLWPMTCAARGCDKAPFPTTGYCSPMCHQGHEMSKRYTSRTALKFIGRVKV